MERKIALQRFVLQNGQTIKCDMLAYAIGIRPCLELVQGIGLNLDRGILVDEHLQTNDPDIFAAGDVAQVFDPLSGRAVLDSLWNPARDQGQVAGMNMAGRKHGLLEVSAVQCHPSGWFDNHHHRRGGARAG